MFGVNANHVEYREAIMVTANCLTLGYLAQLLQQPPAKVRAAAYAAGIKPVLRINEREHYAEADVERIRAALQAD
jgi:hypothetical protein